MEIESEVKLWKFRIEVVVKYIMPIKSISVIYITTKNKPKKFKNREITKEEYDNWRYNYPKFNAFNSNK